jgi:hypothetical protein
MLAMEWHSPLPAARITSLVSTAVRRATTHMSAPTLGLEVLVVLAVVAEIAEAQQTRVQVRVSVEVATRHPVPAALGAAQRECNKGPNWWPMVLHAAASLSHSRTQGASLTLGYYWITKVLLTSFITRIW